MELALSSAAAPDFSLAELLDACRRRGFSGLELVSGGAHGVDPASSAAALAEVRARAAAAGVRLLAYRIGALGEAEHPGAPRLSAALGIPVILPSGVVDAAGIHPLVERFAAASARLLLSHRTWPREAARARSLAAASRGEVGLCWEVRPGADVAGDAPAVLDAAGESLRYVRLCGGGPEAATQTGQGIGPLMGRLALARYRGPLVLAPSDARFHHAWRSWLGRRAGWGCGSKTSDSTLVVLTA